MKKLVLGIVAIAGISYSTHAQLTVRPGLKAGLNLSHGSVNVSPPLTDSYTGFGPGFYLGGLAEFSSPPGSKFKGQVEALFNFHNVKYSDRDYTLQLSQISVPLMLRYFVTPDFSLNGGGSLNFNVGGKAKFDNSTTDLKDRDGLNGFQPGLLVGATYYIKNGFFVDGRYNYYFGDYMKDVDKASIGAFQLGIGYKF